MSWQIKRVKKMRGRMESRPKAVAVIAGICLGLNEKERLVKNVGDIFHFYLYNRSIMLRSIIYA